jgi:hypothetical protein
LSRRRTWLVFGKRGSMGAVFGSLAMSASLIADTASSSPMVLGVSCGNPEWPGCQSARHKCPRGRTADTWEKKEEQRGGSSLCAVQGAGAVRCVHVGLAVCKARWRANPGWRGRQAIPPARTFVWQRRFSCCSSKAQLRSRQRQQNLPIARGKFCNQKNVHLPLVVHTWALPLICLQIAQRHARGNSTALAGCQRALRLGHWATGERTKPL